jgi:glycosyltransferase involved in cell wall biosynthesis
VSQVNRQISRPEVSVVIPTRNRAGMLPATVESALLAGTNLEVLVVDDASEDDTAHVCARLRGVRYIRIERGAGPASARNVGIEASSGEFIAFLDDDDMRVPGTLDRQLEVLKACERAGFVYGRAYLGDSRFCLPTGQLIPDESPRGDVFWELLEGNFVPTSTVLARRRCLLEVGLFNPGMMTLEDYDLWVRLAERYEVEAVGEPVAIYRTRSESSGQLTSDRSFLDREHKEVFERLLRLPRAAAAPRGQLARARKRHLEVVYGSLVFDAAVAVVNGDKDAARAYLVTAMRLRPLHVKAHVSLLWLLVRNLLDGAG